MADARYAHPRRPGVVIYLHTADIVDALGQRAVMQSMTPEELIKIAESVNQELSTRGENPNELK